MNTLIVILLIAVLISNILLWFALIGLRAGIAQMCNSLIDFIKEVGE